VPHQGQGELKFFEKIIFSVAEPLIAKAVPTSATFDYILIFNELFCLSGMLKRIYVVFATDKRLGAVLITTRFDGV
jgi:hypothetical protein